MGQMGVRILLIASISTGHHDRCSTRTGAVVACISQYEKIVGCRGEHEEALDQPWSRCRILRGPQTVLIHPNLSSIRLRLIVLMQ